MRPTTYHVMVLVLILLFSTFGRSTVGWAAFSDLEDNWAREEILSLEERGLFEDVWAEEFEPHSYLSHETSLELINRAFDLEAEQQADVTTWLKETFAMDPEGITRGEFVALLANVLGLGARQEVPSGWYPSFVDLSLDYPGFLAVEVMQRLALLPSHMLINFEPYRLITRSEVAYLIHEALELEQITGVIAAQGENNQILVDVENAVEHTIQLLPETLYVTSQGLAKDQKPQLEKDQQIVALVRNDKALLVQLEEETTAQAFIQGINNVTKVLADVLTPEQVSAIIAGDWEQLNEEVRYELYDELVKRGAAPWEADALLKQDWESLQTMIQERLTQEAATFLQVTPELVHSAVTRDWPKLLEYAQVELAQRLLTSEWLKGITEN